MSVKSVVVVDDNPADFVGLQRMLRGTCEVHYAETAELLLDAVDRGAIAPTASLFVIDLRLPGKSGSELIKILRTKPEIRHAKFMLWSEVSHLELSLRARECGADGYEHKPWSLSGYVTFARRCQELAAAGG